VSDPCPLCGREKLKDRVQRPPPMAEYPDSYCLHPAHIYGYDLPPCESRGVERIEALTAQLADARQRDARARGALRQVFAGQTWIPSHVAAVLAEFPAPVAEGPAERPNAEPEERSDLSPDEEARCREIVEQLGEALEPELARKALYTIRMERRLARRSPTSEPAAGALAATAGSEAGSGAEAAVQVVVGWIGYEPPGFRAKLTALLEAQRAEGRAEREREIVAWLKEGVCWVTGDLPYPDRWLKREDMLALAKQIEAGAGRKT
jgi:hypothetical protein